jgi:gpW
MSILDGVPDDTLQSWLSDARNAYQQLMTGSKAVILTYGMGDGQKSVTYERINSPKLLQWIGQLGQALKQPHSRRRALRPMF